ncbi:CDP-diacylglycerol--glycerol-3-phosphate 3-phosphatidyltransferase [Salidesulfovibrio onnuriiensis]|uniref:CDP-diacylglycerol--glycerol-3-phosphate 3-phosphatidyltransferase n=1 Tax=Salidesulfovibrio onnuriiensis TaxID=2583823 RepID=UPI0011CC1C34|nr:CDP-diacylglycerol--glycerol-3-phosphate 3-phosphatidyltransferase [Salidesulfovibrio onnuriiensis]
MNRELFNLPNTLTLTRILAAPIIVVLLYFHLWFGWKFGPIAAAIVFMLASLTDMFDGIIARQQNLITNLGKFLDPLADKLLICSVLIMLVRMGADWKVPAWVVIIIVAREIAVTGMRAIAAERGDVIPADKFGKMKTIVQSLALAPLLWHYPLFGINLVLLGQVLLYTALVLTVFSGGNYLYNFYRNWLMNEES